MTEQESSRAGTPAGADYFAVFSLPRKLALDAKELERSFYRLSREVHPDRFAQASPEKQQWSLEQTSLLNDAYRALKNPLTRVEYLLRLEGITVADEKSAAKAPPELLEEIFELNMQLEEMRANQRLGEEDPALRAELERAREQFAGMLAAMDAEIAQASGEWDAADGEAARAGALAKLAALLDKRRYVRNLLRDVGEALG